MMETYRQRRLGTMSVAFVVSTVLFQNSPSSALAETRLLQRGAYQLAQVSDSCRQVVSQGGLYVRQAPTVQSPALGIVGAGRNVTIKNRGVNGWAPISAPLEGYVYAGFLSFCQQESPPPSSCRQVKTTTVDLLVRQEPTVNGAVVGTISNGRRVTIVNRGANGWVPITVPLSGYVSSDYLVYCQ